MSLDAEDEGNVPQRFVDNGSMLTKEVRGNCVCIALMGTLGKKVCCSIYSRRPLVCREYPRGGVDCRRLNDSTRG